jgi:hypothetical protein
VVVVPGTTTRLVATRPRAPEDLAVGIPVAVVPATPEAVGEPVVLPGWTGVIAAVLGTAGKELASTRDLYPQIPKAAQANGTLISPEGEMRRQMNVHLSNAKWSLVPLDDTRVRVYRIDAFLATGSTDPPLVTGAGNKYSPYTYSMWHLARAETIGGKNGIALTIFVQGPLPNIVAPDPLPYPPDDYIMFIVDQDGWDGIGEFVLL